jgi:hypothetical protein
MRPVPDLESPNSSTSERRTRYATPNIIRIIICIASKIPRCTRPSLHTFCCIRYQTPNELHYLSGGSMINHFTTNDLNCASFLIATNVPLISSAKDERGIMTFSFAQTDELLQLIEQYYSLNAQVSPQKFAGAQKMLKNVLYRSSSTNTNVNYGNRTNSKQPA